MAADGDQDSHFQGGAVGQDGDPGFQLNWFWGSQGFYFPKIYVSNPGIFFSYYNGHIKTDDIL